MRIVYIDDKYKNINFFSGLLISESSILLSNDDMIIIENIDIKNKKIVEYIVYRILDEENLVPDIKLTPINGLEYINKMDISKGLGIYHAHLNNDMVLTWYLEYIDGDFYLKLIYDKHPNTNDSYKPMLTNIYKNPKSYDIIRGKYLKEKLRVLNFNDFNVNNKF